MKRCPHPRILRAADRAASPWKNGQGITREIAVHPDAAGLDDFEWRASIATVDRSGPFSVYPGVDRKLVVLQGRLSLVVDGGAPIHLDRDAPAIGFAGDLPVEARVISGPVTDLNLMVRRGSREATLERVVVNSSMRVGGDSVHAIVLALDAVQFAHDEILEPLDAVLLAPGETAILRSDTSASRVVTALIRWV